MTKVQKVRPARKLLTAASHCSQYGIEYGNCVLQKYQTIKNGDCQQEFQRFKTCVNENMAKK